MFKNDSIDAHVAHRIALSVVRTATHVMPVVTTVPGVLMRGAPNVPFDGLYVNSRSAPSPRVPVAELLTNVG